ncbi:MAG: transketolase [Anaerolineales bacterium]|nr:transketolase [Anaerolineales bacterium]
MISNSQDLQQKSINTIRFLSADAVQKANSGHPGLPMGAAALAYTLWTRHLRFNPENPSWPDRDRFVLSGGHGSMLLYSLLYLTGFDLPLEEIKNFRQWESMTPGHPEVHLTPGVETTTGPLGQGFGNGVGFAIAEAHLAAVFNQPGHDIINHYTYALVTDGDLMEGVSAEAASLAGHLKLGKLIYLYDDNHISIDGNTDLTFTEDTAARFETYGWHVQKIENGNDVNAIHQAIQSAKEDERPSLISVRTHIGYGLPTKQDTAEAHGAPPGDEELEAAKERLGWPKEPRFFVPEDVLAFFRQVGKEGDEREGDWRDRFETYRADHPDLAQELERRLEGRLPEGWTEGLPTFSADPKGMATRAASGKVINAITTAVPDLIGGSADLAPSNKTWIDGSPDFQSQQYHGRNFHFGVREHAMGAIVNGMGLHGGVIPYAGTFLVFSDYMRPAVRLSALSKIPALWIYTHDSIGLGEDGPTHQPIEQLSSLRAIPGIVVIRPMDANEVVQAWKVAISDKKRPMALVLTRQNVPVVDRSSYASAVGLEKGAYVLADVGEGDPEIILMASGSEVDLILKAGEKLAEEGVSIRVVSFPSWELFEEQDQEYQDSVLLPDLKMRLAVEAGVGQGWYRWVGSQGLILSVETFGASAPGSRVFKEYGFTVENVINKARNLVKEER